MKAMLSKFMMLLVLTVILTSPSAFAATFSTHIDPISSVTCKHGDQVSVTAQLWCENYFKGLWDNRMEYEDLYFYLYSLNAGDHYQEVVLEKTKETSFLSGKATAKIDTKNLNPGNYLLVIQFKGDYGTFIDFEPCKTETNVTITS